MRLDKVLFGIVLAICVVIGVTMLVPEAPQGHGFRHLVYPSMSQSRPGLERHGQILWLGWAFGTLQILLFVCLMAFGARKKDKLRGLGKPLLYAAIVYIGVWTLLVITYQRYMTETTHRLFLALPAPTAVMLYGLWHVPALFTLIFVIGFRRWYATDEDLAEFDALLAKKRRREGGDLEGEGP